MKSNPFLCACVAGTLLSLPVLSVEIGFEWDAVNDGRVEGYNLRQVSQTTSQEVLHPVIGADNTTIIIDNTMEGVIAVNVQAYGYVYIHNRPDDPIAMESDWSNTLFVSGDSLAYGLPVMPTNLHLSISYNDAEPLLNVDEGTPGEALTPGGPVYKLR